MHILNLITDFWDALLFFSIPIVCIVGWWIVDD